ncbi:MAG: hypothetical protein JWQ38_1575 [Flavipsychrobacter sp.]|nr:hypothetical protein [Flavipsychrobacter sp.]
MSYERRANTQYRTSMDIVMGIFYLFIGGLVFFMKSFANVAIPAAIAYILGGMMIVGGGARLYRGLRVVFPKKDNQPTDNG